MNALYHHASQGGSGRLASGRVSARSRSNGTNGGKRASRQTNGAEGAISVIIMDGVEHRPVDIERQIFYVVRGPTLWTDAGRCVAHEIHAPQGVAPIGDGKTKVGP